MNPKKLALAAAAVVAVGLLVAFLTRPSSPPTTEPGSTTVSGDPKTATGSPAGTGGGPNTTNAPPSGGGGRVGSPAASGAGGVELGTALTGAKKLEAARAALAEGNPKKALEEIESYEKIPDRPLKEEATILKIEALSKVGRKTDALALAMSSREDPAFATYQPRIDALITDAGLVH